MRMRTKVLPALLLVALALAGCVSTGEGGLTRAQIADMALTQLEATIQSAEAVSAILAKDGVPPEEYKKATLILAALKPQVLSWINMIETIIMTQKQYDEADALMVRAQVFVQLPTVDPGH